MADANGIKTRRDLEIAVIKKALGDASFKQTLMTNPHAAVASALSAQTSGARLPATLDVKAIQEPQNAFYLVIPHVGSGAELSDTELERVAGGVDEELDAIKIRAEWSR